MRRLLPFLLPFAVIVLAGGGVILWLRLQERPLRGAPVEVPLSQITLDTPFVRVSGMAHYPIEIRQRTAGNLFRDEKTHYLFPLFEENDSDARAIRLLVRTERAPEDLVGFEFMTLEGRILQPTVDQIPFDTEVILGKRTEYFFTDDMLLLEPWRIESDGEVWELPE